jgi:hypothetical protein
MKWVIKYKILKSIGIKLHEQYQDLLYSYISEVWTLKENSRTEDAEMCLLRSTAEVTLQQAQPL